MYIISVVHSRAARIPRGCKCQDLTTTVETTCEDHAASFQDKLHLTALKSPWILAAVVVLVLLCCCMVCAASYSNARPAKCDCVQEPQASSQLQTDNRETAAGSPGKWQKTLGGCLGYGCSCNCYKYQPIPEGGQFCSCSNPNRQPGNYEEVVKAQPESVPPPPSVSQPPSPQPQPAPAPAPAPPETQPAQPEPSSSEKKSKKKSSKKSRSKSRSKKQKK